MPAESDKINPPNNEQLRRYFNEGNMPLTYFAHPLKEALRSASGYIADNAEWLFKTRPGISLVVSLAGLGLIFHSLAEAVTNQQPRVISTVPVSKSVADKSETPTVIITPRNPVIPPKPRP